MKPCNSVVSALHFQATGPKFNSGFRHGSLDLSSLQDWQLSTKLALGTKHWRFCIRLITQTMSSVVKEITYKNFIFLRADQEISENFNIYLWPSWFHISADFFIEIFLSPLLHGKVFLNFKLVYSLNFFSLISYFLFTINKNQSSKFPLKFLPPPSSFSM